MEKDKETGVGDLLRAEREKKGLTREQVAMTTRLRKHFIEALENEEWENLPSPVFIRGFIRSYARAVGFDGKEAVSLYNRIAPVKEGIPKPLAGPREPKRRAVFILIPILLIFLIVIYLWKGQETPLPEESVIPPAVQEKDVGEVKPPPAEKQETTPVEPEKIAPPESNDEPVNPPPESVIPAAPEEETMPAPPVETAQPVNDLVLKGIVNMRTWIKIYVDDNPPLEYIFQPGSRPQWTAKKGFDVLVGNAAGIEFEFNGKRIKDLGDLGKVVRVRFPEDFESELYED